MGVGMLKRKKELNYRRGYTHKDCSGCDHYVASFEVMSCANNGGVLRTEPRCAPVGLQSGRAYRINPNSVCDAFDNTKGLERMKRGWTP